mmetsp:Transcript_206/g.418  ORF Transcript_206/g.418 Transcript_206/m.418 type:complete len:531 (-) Transcript_206:223-1815(-)|eukprot:CAMPEP_0184653496 /NCGR_PEP_ID=MMETSP0308-20130426/11206_1 /TAXON_ID=38269 /ORGANISM="Gloeochaete witrockiana, Strain SAG 46.84" /LENGTH=530 /DNA_ID=CAMNT_0027088981 /DNA_START=236 /DNA_END=1828 /DNA_ORIENTATION=+
MSFQKNEAQASKNEGVELGLLEDDFDGKTESARNGNHAVDGWQNSSPSPTEETAQRSAVTKGMMKRFMFGIGMVYFFLGLTDFTDLAGIFYEKDDLHLQPYNSQLVEGSLWIPWMIKPLYGFISDMYPIFGYRRKPYLVLSAFAASLTYLVLGLSKPSLAVYMIFLDLNNVGVTWGDVIADSMIVEKIGDNAPYSSSLQSFVWATRTVGSLMAAWLGGAVLDYISPRAVYLLAAALPAPILLTWCLLQETPANANSQSTVTLKEQLSLLKKALSNPIIWKSALFIYAISSTPTSDSAMMYFFTNKLGLDDDKEFFGRRDTLINLCSLVGIFAFERYLKRIRLRPLFLWTTLIATVIQLANLLLVTRANVTLHIPDKVFLLGDSGVVAILQQIQLMPILILAAKVCPKGIEGTLYAFLMSISNGSALSAQYWGSFAMWSVGVTAENFNNLWLLILICALSTPVPLIFIGCIPNYDPEDPSTIDEQIDRSSTQMNVLHREQDDGNSQGQGPGQTQTVRPEHRPLLYADGPDD